MLVAMETKDGRGRGPITVVAKELAWHVQTYLTIKLKVFFSIKYSYCFNVKS